MTRTHAYVGVAGALLSVVAACSNTPTGSPGAAWDAGTERSSPARAGLIVSITSTTAGPLYPFDSADSQHRVTLRYAVTVENRTEHELLDLRVVVPIESRIATGARVTVTEGGYSAVQGGAVRAIEWLAPEHGPIRTDVTIERDPKVLSEDPNALPGEVSVDFAAEVRQYDVVLGRSEPVTVRLYSPERVSSDDLEVFGGRLSAGQVVLSARPRGGPFAGRGGIYRLETTSSSADLLYAHAATDRLGTFAASTDRVYVATSSGTGAPMDTIVAVSRTSSSTPASVPLPADVREVRALEVASSTAFALVEKKGGGYAALALDPTSLTGLPTASMDIGRPVEDTLEVTNECVVFLQEAPPAIVRLELGTLSSTTLATVGSISGRRSLACNETTCFWTEWTEGSLFSVPLRGGEKSKRTSTNQPIVWDGKHIYSGINGLIRYEPGRSVAERLFLSGVVQLLGATETHVFFLHEGRVFRLHT